MAPDRDPVTLRFDQGTLVLERIGRAELAGALGDGFGAWRWDARISAWRAHAIEYAGARAALADRLGPRFRDDVFENGGRPHPRRVSWSAVDLPALRPEQQAALSAWRDAGCRGQVVMPTGTGKTEVALAAMAAARPATLVVAPIRDLMYQWHRRILRGLGFDAGVVGDTRFDTRPVTVTTYDSAYAHMGALGATFELVVFDEMHHLPGPCRREAALLSAAPMRLGLSATPERSDGLHADLDDLIGPVVYRQDISDARGRTLADYSVVRIPVALTDAEQARYDDASRLVRSFIVERQKEQKSYTWRDLCAESGSDPAARRAQKAYWHKQAIEARAAEKLRVLEDLFRLHAGERVIVFAGSNAMAMDVSRRFLVPALLSHSRKRERLAVLEGFAEGRFPVLVANRVLDEGIDVPAAKVAVVIGGQASTRQAKQRLGRVLRRSGATQAVLYEVICGDTKEEDRSRRRRKSDAYDRTRHRRL
jgi:superfamily II DNA or RNA helicase